MEKNPPKKILMIGWEYPPFNSGGLGTACKGISQGLAQKGLVINFTLPQIVDLFSSSINFIFPKISKTKKDEVPLYLYSYMTVSGQPSLRKQHLGLVQETERYAKLIVGMIKDLKFDLIHAHDWLSVPAAMAVHEISKKPLLLHIHALEFDRSGGSVFGNSKISEIEKKGIMEADSVIAVSAYTKNKIVECYNINPDKISVVYNGINSQGLENSIGRKLSFFKDKKIVLFVGRLTIQKGVEGFIRSAQIVLAKEPEALFVLAGDGELKKEAIELVNKLGISKNVIFTGFLKEEELVEVYKIAQVYVLPSLSEPFGIAPLEAIKCNTPVILSRNSGVSEIIKGSLKVDFWDIDKMAEKILAVLNYSTLQKQLIDDGKRDIEKLSWRVAADKIDKIYEGMINNI